MNAYSYMRCSGQGQIEGDTWDRQEAAIRQYAIGCGYEIVNSFRDEGVSGRTELLDRFSLTECLESCKQNDVKVVIVESADRLARDLIVAELLIAEFQKAGVTIMATGGYNLTEGSDANPTAKLVRQILSAIAEFDRSVTVLKLRGARQRKKAQTGRCEGVKPYGSLPGESTTLNCILDMNRAGVSIEFITKTLNADSSLWSRRKLPWRASTIRKIIKAQALRPNLDVEVRP